MVIAQTPTHRQRVAVASTHSHDPLDELDTFSTFLSIADLRQRKAKMRKTQVAVRTLVLAGVLLFSGYYEVSTAPATPHPLGQVIGCLAILLGVQQGLLVLFRQFSLAEKLTNAHVAENEEDAEERIPLRTSSEKLACRALIALAIFVSLLGAIRFSSPDPSYDTFPSACSASMMEGCSRVAYASPHRDLGLTPLNMHLSIPNIQRLVTSWATADEPRGHVVVTSSSSKHILFHARFASFVFGFVDDLVVDAKCAADDDTEAEGECAKVVLQAQGQLRIGQSDLNVNQKRIARLWAYMQHQPRDTFVTLSVPATPPA
mmetsp:Transcript_37825/g.63616  ORF Transcript_37825/g.63616 Transcript_37825/m.63616 type:complete len:317 (-) Transcript_37825:38-988(-)